ncbi:nicotinate-nucleotide--dimethylbenzimidazole phosphoribosyltransferase [bacterium]|nr:nicotinate-nucleotide--dimethylbenzimidazole phosphoribosyltransferase [bacterium]MBU1615326.1 nicotinate-nucleotide--dimethylbenzimidazole phosphoribosyltransferase [bacterium]
MSKLKETLSGITPVREDLSGETQRRLDNLTKPQGSLGRLEELAKKVVVITGNEKPVLTNKVIFTMAGDHGVAEEGVSLFPSEVTPQMVYNFVAGGAGINVLARHVGVRVVVVDMGVAADLEPHPEIVDKKVGYGTKNMVKEPAMSREEAIKALCAGIEVFEEELKKGIDIVGTGDMGIANTTASSAIVACITGAEVEKVTGRGTGITDEAWQNKVRAIKKALALNRPDPRDPVDVLAKVGGFEIGGLAGVILAAANHRVPVIIDGFISGAAALIATEIEPKVKDYLIAAHCSVEIGHKITLEKMGLRPLLDLDLRLGEGTGAALGMSIVEAGCKILNEMATFESAGVSEAADE